jgi:hypothetical protein
MEDAELRPWLREIKTIAVVGLSDDTNRPSQRVASSLKFWGYTILPVNPDIETALGERAYSDLASLPTKPDLVLVFRRPEFAAAIAAEVARLGYPALWFQPGTGTPEAAATAEAVGVRVVSGPCLAKEYLRLFGKEL